MHANDKSMATRSWKLGEIVTIIKNRAKDLLPAELFVLNVGAADSFGGPSDPTYDLFAKHPDAGGLLLDFQTGEQYFSKYIRRDNIKFVLGKESMPSPVDYGKFLQEHNAPKQLTAVKIDIDSWECTIIENLLNTGYSSVIFHVEFNPTFPLPIRFSPVYTGKEEDYDEQVWMLRSPFYGCSLARMADLLIPAGYRLIEVDGWDSTWVHNEFATLFQPLPADLHTAWFAGWRSRNTLQNGDAPCLLRDHKLYSSELALLAQVVAHAVKEKNQAAIDQAMTSIRVFVEKAGSHQIDDGSPHPYLLQYAGAHDQHIHRCINQR